MVQFLFAFLAGILTIAAPCILPMLPIILGASVGQKSKVRPLFIVMGFVMSFAAASLLLSTLVTHLGLSQNFIRNIAIALLVIFAFFMIFPKPFELLTVKLSGVIGKASDIGGSREGYTGAFILGLVLGIVWTPCAGPVLGTILTLIATQGTAGKASLLVIFYATGAGVPMIIIAYGSQWLTTRIRGLVKYSVKLQQAFGVLIILLAVAMFFQYDTIIENKLTAFFPQSDLEQKLLRPNTSVVENGRPLISADNKVELNDYGAAPDFVGTSKWINSSPLSKDKLKGKVVLIDFWTYSCINCIRTLPYTTKWYDTYKDKGFVIIGVHTPEFAFEKDVVNVQTAVQRLGIYYPVIMDNDYATWSAYKNQFWPAEYLIDQNGKIVYKHFGEGNYERTENTIRKLLGINQGVGKVEQHRTGSVQSPEMYFKLSRLKYLAPEQSASAQPKQYLFPDKLALNSFALQGEWQFGNDHAELTRGPGQIRLHFSSGKLFMVAAADKLVKLKISVDGRLQPDVAVQMSRLYTLFDSNDYRGHMIEIEIPSKDFKAFTFTFG